MRIIEIRPSKKFKGAWVAFEAPGVEPAFATANPKADATSYACNRFGGTSGEVHVFDETGSLVDRIRVDDSGKYPGAG